MRILLIEDNESIAEIVRRSLALFSLPDDEFTLDYAPDGIVGLQLARTNAFDGYLIDLTSSVLLLKIKIKWHPDKC